MKKYIKPQIEVNEIETESFLCTSGGLDNSLDKTNTITDPTEILSKDQKYDIWGLGDDDDEY